MSLVLLACPRAASPVYKVGMAMPRPSSCGCEMAAMRNCPARTRASTAWTCRPIRLWRRSSQCSTPCSRGTCSASPTTDVVCNVHSCLLSSRRSRRRRRRRRRGPRCTSRSAGRGAGRHRANRRRVGAAGAASPAVTSARGRAGTGAARARRTVRTRSSGRRGAPRGTHAARSVVFGLCGGWARVSKRVRLGTRGSHLP